MSLHPLHSSRFPVPPSEAPSVLGPVFLQHDGTPFKVLRFVYAPQSPLDFDESASRLRDMQVRQIIARWLDARPLDFAVCPQTPQPPPTPAPAPEKPSPVTTAPGTRVFQCECGSLWYRWTGNQFFCHCGKPSPFPALGFNFSVAAGDKLNHLRPELSLHWAVFQSDRPEWVCRSKGKNSTHTGRGSDPHHAVEQWLTAIPVHLVTAPQCREEPPLDDSRTVDDLGYPRRCGVLESEGSRECRYARGHIGCHSWSTETLSKRDDSEARLNEVLKPHLLEGPWPVTIKQVVEALRSVPNPDYVDAPMKVAMARFFELDAPSFWDRLRQWFWK